MNNLEQVNNSSTTEQVPFSEVGRLWSTYLYNHPEVREWIESLRKQQGLPSRNHVKVELADSSMDVLLMAKYKRIMVLEAEVKRLKEQLKSFGGEIYANL